MFFGNKSMDAEEFDFSNKEGREKARKRLLEMLGNVSPKDRKAAQLLGAMFGVMDQVPDEFALVHEVKTECLAMEKKLRERVGQLEEVAKLFEHGQPVHRMGMVDAYLTVAGGALAGAAEILRYLERSVAKASAEKEEKETPTEAPPPPEAEQAPAESQPG